MAKDKKSFVLYVDQKTTIDQLPDDVAGRLLKHLYAYCNDENPVSDELLLNIAFEPIKQTLKRDLKRYEGRAERSRFNGSKGGRPKKPRKPSGLIENPDEPRKPDSVSDSVSDINIMFDKFWNYYDKKRNKDKAQKLFLKLSDSEMEELRLALPAYLESTPDKQYRKDPDVYLRNKCWNDEIIKPQAPKQRIDRL